MRNLLKQNLPEGVSVGDFIKSGNFGDLLGGTPGASDIAGKLNVGNLADFGGLSGNPLFNVLKGAIKTGQAGQNPTKLSGFGKLERAGDIFGLFTGNPLLAAKSLFGRQMGISKARQDWIKYQKEKHLPSVVGEQKLSGFESMVEDLASSKRALQTHGGEKSHPNPLGQILQLLQGGQQKDPFLMGSEGTTSPSRFMFAKGGKVPSTLSPYLSESYKRYLRGGQPQEPSRSYRGGGMVNGPSHAQGGVQFNTGGQVHELEGGEAVINKKSTEMFKDILLEAEW